MSATGTAQAQNKAPQKWQKGGPSPNPGGIPKGLRELQATILAEHGPKLVTALKELLDLGLKAESEKVRVSALDAYVGHVSSLSGMATLAKQQPEESPANEGELLGRVIDGVLAKPENRELVAAKLQVLAGGKP